MADNTTISRMVAMYNAAAELLGESPVKSFKDRTTAAERLNEAVGRLSKRQHSYFPQQGDAPALRDSSPRHKVIELLDRDEGATVADIEAALAPAYEAKGRKVPYVPGLIVGVRTVAGRGYRRIGDRFWLVPA